MTTLPDYKSSFPVWHAKELEGNIAGCDAESRELIAVSYGGGNPVMPRLIFRGLTRLGHACV